MSRVPLATVVREWGRIGVVGFGGPPAHVALLRELCVDRRRWVDAREFEDANAACGLLPGPASTQLAIFLAHRVGGTRGAVAGGLAFIVPGLVLLVALAAASLQEAPPGWLAGAAAGAGAAVIAVVLRVGLDLGRASLAGRGARAVAYLAVGAATTVFAGPWVVLALLACGAVELVWRRGMPGTLVAVEAALVWTAFKVGALSYGGGFVIVPLMQADALRNAWMTEAEFLNAVALGQITPGPVVQTVAAVGYAAAGLPGAALAAVVAFAPSFAIVLLGGGGFARLRRSAGARAFLDGAGPAAVGAILGAAVPLLDGVTTTWQAAVAVGAAVALLAGRLGVVPVLLAAAAVGALAGA